MINWKWWRRMWQFRVERYYLKFTNPWFGIEIRTGTGRGEDDFYPWESWRGLRIHWGHKVGWTYAEGEIMYYKCDCMLGPDYHPKMRWM